MAKAVIEAVSKAVHEKPVCGGRVVARSALVRSLCMAHKFLLPKLSQRSASFGHTLHSFVADHPNIVATTAMNRICTPAAVVQMSKNTSGSYK